MKITGKITIYGFLFIILISCNDFQPRAIQEPVNVIATVKATAMTVVALTRAAIPIATPLPSSTPAPTRTPIPTFTLSQAEATIQASCPFFMGEAQRLHINIGLSPNNEACNLSYTSDKQTEVITSFIYPKYIHMSNFNHVSWTSEPIFLFHEKSSMILFYDFADSTHLENPTYLERYIGAGIWGGIDTKNYPRNQKTTNIGNKQVLEVLSQNENNIRKYYYWVHDSHIYVFSTYTPGPNANPQIFSTYSLTPNANPSELANISKVVESMIASLTFSNGKK